MPLTGREKATIFLSILGAETSARVLRYLPDELADLIAAGINHLPAPSPDALSEVLAEFKSYVALPQGPSDFSRLAETTQPKTPKKSYAILMYERPQIIALILSQLSAAERAEALLTLPREKAVVEDLLKSLKHTPLTEKISAKLKEHFGAKIF